MRVKVYATLREVVGAAAVEVESGPGATLGDVLSRLLEAHPQLAPEVFDDLGQLHSHVHVLVNGRDVRFMDGLHTVVDGVAQIDIFPPVGGGRTYCASSK